MENPVFMKVRSGYDRPPADDPEAGSSRDDSASTKGGSKRAYNEIEDHKFFSSSEPNKDWKLEGNRLESARAEMEEVREENQRLKTSLSQIMKDYQALQKKFYDTIQPEETKKSTSTVDNHGHQTVDEEPELVSLSLGRFSGDRYDKSRITTSTGQRKDDNDDDDMTNDEGLSLILDSKFQASKSRGNDNSSPNSNPMDSCEEAGDTEVKARATTINPSGEEEAVQLKKARVCVRARCDTPTMNDGCQWRKYGQKIAKGNPCPRAYYRCTVAPTCPVRKQVQRCADDMSILKTTYEGTHNHPLPYSATAMASTTCAAASMLLSGSSSSSRTGPNNSPAIPADLRGLNFYLSNSNSKQFYVHNSPLSSSPSHPTITIDLTTTSNPSSPFIRSFSSAYPSIPKFAPAATLNFGSSESSTTPWSNGFFGQGNSSSSQPYNKSPLTGNSNLARSTMESNIFQSCMQNKTPAPPFPHHQQPGPDPISAATKAITADPNFQSALVAALTSIIGTGNGGGSGGNLVSGDNLAEKLKWGEHFPASSSYSSTTSTPPKGNACGTSYMNKTTSANTQPLMFLPPNSPPFSSPGSSSASPNDTRDHTG